MKRNVKHRAPIANSQLWGSSSIFLWPLLFLTRGINPKHISQAFVRTIYEEAERARAMSNILGTGFFILCTEGGKFKVGIIEFKESISEGRTML